MGMLSAKQLQSLERATIQYMSSIGLAEGYLESRGVSLEVAGSAALGVVDDPMPGHENLRGRLAIPYLTDAGPVNMTFRCIRQHECKLSGCPKYLVFPGLDRNVYGVQALDEADDTVVVCEGEIDQITMYHLMGIPAIGVPGAKNWEPHWTMLMADFARLIVPYDGDQAGKEFAKRVSKECTPNGTVVELVALDDKMDVNSTYLRDGADALRERLNL